jgi:hypothetical protein
MKEKLNIGLLVRVSFKKFNPIKQNKAMKNNYASANGSDASMYGATTRMVSKVFIDPLQKIETECRTIVERYTLPWEDRGNRLLPAKNVPKLQEELANVRKRWDYAVEDYIVEWDKIVADAQSRLNGDFNYDNYPAVETVKARFTMQTVFMPMPDNSRLVEEIRDEMEDIFSDRMKSASQNLRTRLVDKLAHLAAKCAEAEDGEKTRFYSSNIDNVIELCKAIPDMLIEDDKELTDAVESAERLLAGLDADDIKHSPDLARDVRDRAKAIVDSIKL